MTVGELLQQALTHEVSRLRKQEQRLREGADSAVHQMRISVRRSRSLLATYRPVLLPGVADELRAELRWLGSELADARDAQVLRERLEAMVADEPVELVMGPVLRRVGSDLSTRYQQGSARGLAALDSDRFVHLMADLEAFAADPPLAEGACEAAATALPRLLRRDLRRVRKRRKAVRAADVGASRDQALHDTRKAAKRLRYAAESAVPVLGRPADRLASRAKAVQQLLGEHQDTVVARGTLRELGVAAFLADENGFTFGRLHALEQARAERIEAELTATFRRLPGKRLGRWLEP